MKGKKKMVMEKLGNDIFSKQMEISQINGAIEELSKIEEQCKTHAMLNENISNYLKKRRKQLYALLNSDKRQILVLHTQYLNCINSI